MAARTARTSECACVEKLFLDQLAALGWHVVDQEIGVPSDLAKSYRPSFREVILKDVFCQNVWAINTIEELFEQIARQPGKSFVEAS